MALHVNVLRLLAAANVSVDSSITAAVNDSADLLGITDPWNVTLNITTTPIGAYVVTSIEVFTAPGVTVYVDVTLIGQVNGTLSASSGALNRTSMTWLQWGGQNATFTAPSGTTTSTITANFVYFASSAFVVRFSIPGVTDFLEALGIPTSFPIVEFPLGEAPFAQSARVRIDTIDVEAMIAARTQAETALAAEQAQTATLSAELTASRGDLDSSRGGWGQTNATLAQTQRQLDAANAIAAGSVGLPLVLVAALGGLGGGMAAGWFVGRRRGEAGGSAEVPPP
jgi:hypothetical protein